MPTARVLSATQRTQGGTLLGIAPKSEELRLETCEVESFSARGVNRRKLLDLGIAEMEKVSKLTRYAD
jgi:hypothetical protein